MVDSDKNLLAEEKKKADLLLSNILPGYMIEDLKRYGKVQPVQYDQVAVMFTDFVGFSKISRYMSPTQLLKELTIYFDEFERICEIYSIEKVKTIGDSFLCVAGLSGNHRTAGIVGHQKIAFDIWGHTVNIAARIEGLGKGGEITVSRNMFDFTRDLFDFDYIGERELKGVGMHDLYKLSGLKTGLYAKNDKTKFIPNVNFYKLFEALRDGKYIISKQSHDRELEAKKEILSNSL
jgi:adenylate cyclase